jgi:hypothetical protein
MLIAQRQARNGQRQQGNIQGKVQSASIHRDYPLSNGVYTIWRLTENLIL